MVHESFLEPEDLDRFKLLILPGIVALSDPQCERIRQFVKRGGSVVATFETSLCDETGRKRTDFGLADLFGVALAGNTEPFIKNSYIHLEHDTHHPILRGRIAYFPGNNGHTFWEVLDPDHGRLLANVVRWALNEPDVVSVTGLGVLDISVWEQDGSMTVHLVNLTNPMMMKGPVRELYAVGPQQVSIRLPAGRRAREVRLLVSKADPQPQYAGNVLGLTLPSILDHEVVAITY